MASDSDSRRRLLVAAAVMAAMFAIGAFLSLVGRPSSPDGQPSDETASAPRPTVPAGVAGPVAERAGVPVGFGRDERGAVAAGVAYSVAPQRWLYFTDEEISSALAEIATPIARPRLTDDVLTDVRLAREQLGTSPGRVWWLVRPLAWRVERFSPDEARVAVWTVTVLSAAGVAAPQTEWVTVTVDLAWVDGDWRVDAVRDTPGPTPQTGPKDQPWDAVPFDESLAGFTRMDGEELS